MIVIAFKIVMLKALSKAKRKSWKRYSESFRVLGLQLLKRRIENKDLTGRPLELTLNPKD